MDDLFLILALLSIVAFFIGLIKPSVFTRFLKERATRKGVAAIFGTAAIVFFVLFGITAEPSSTTQPATKNSVVTEQQEQSSEPAKPLSEKEVKPEITQLPQQEAQRYPSFAKETMDRDCILSCEGGDEVVLWDKPTSAAKGARLHDKVPCGTRCWAFNKYYNEEYNITFYAVNTLDPRVENAWGWITEDLITWLEE